MTKLLHLSLVALLMLICVPASSGAISPIKIGIAPSGENSVSLAQQWIPFLEELEKNSGLPMRFATAPDLLEFNERLGQGEYDLVVTDHYLYTIFSQKHKLAYLGELARAEENTQVALVVAPGIKSIEQLKGSLLAVKSDEKANNIQSLDDYLASKGVNAVRDSLPSYEKILASVGEELHLAGLVPISVIKQSDKSYNILWQADNKHSYVMSSPPGISPQTVQKLSATLKALLDHKAKLDDESVSVLSVKQDTETDTGQE